jgi:hypothetical protein
LTRVIVGRIIEVVSKEIGMAERLSASDVTDRLTSRPLSPRQLAERERKLPPIRLRADVASLDVDEATPVTDALTGLQSRGVDALALRELGSDATAVVLPVERYLDLVAKELLNGNQLVAQPGGRVTPTEAAFAASYVEEVNPGEGTWRRNP